MIYERNPNSYTIKEEDYFNVIKYFLNNDDNKTRVISEKFSLKWNYVSYMIDVHLSFKSNYLGYPPKIKQLEKYTEMNNKLKSELLKDKIKNEISALEKDLLKLELNGII